MQNGKFSEPIFTKIVGVTFDNRQEVCKLLFPGAHLLLVREPDNIHDKNAVGVFFDGSQCGYISKQLSPKIAELLDNGAKLEVIVVELTGGDGQTIGVNIRINMLEISVNREIPDKLYSNNVDDLIEEDGLYDDEDENEEDKIELTDEQKAIIEYDVCGDAIVNIIAFAGTGKTTTLLEYSKARPDVRFLYIAFNKSVQTSAERKFPPNVTCKTSHSLAFSSFGFKHKNRLISNLRLKTVKSLLSLNTYKDAKIVHEILLNYLMHPDSKLSKMHLPKSSKMSNGNKLIYLKMAAKLWLMMCDEKNGDIGMLHDGYLKLYQLSNPELHFDCILLDEAQDTNPVVTDIVLKQKCPKILVGDPHQQIYGLMWFNFSGHFAKSN